MAVSFYKICIKYDSCYYVAATVSFAQSFYFINESDGVVQVEIILSNLSSTNIAVQVESSDVTAIGMCRKVDALSSLT